MAITVRSETEQAMFNARMAWKKLATLTSANSKTMSGPQPGGDLAACGHYEATAHGGTKADRRQYAGGRRRDDLAGCR